LITKSLRYWLLHVAARLTPRTTPPLAANRSAL